MTITASLLAPVRTSPKSRESGETKILGSDFNAVFHLNGVPNAKFVINLVDESVKNNSVTLNGVNWSFRNSTLVDYTEILSFPYISELNSTSGDGWLKVFPASIKANHSIESKTVYFEFKFNCSYYEL